MQAIESRIVYVDDSGSEPDPRVHIIVAAFCPLYAEEAKN